MEHSHTALHIIKSVHTIPLWKRRSGRHLGAVLDSERKSLVLKLVVGISVGSGVPDDAMK